MNSSRYVSRSFQKNVVPDFRLFLLAPPSLDRQRRSGLRYCPTTYVAAPWSPKTTPMVLASLQHLPKSADYITLRCGETLVVNTPICRLHTFRHNHSGLSGAVHSILSTSAGVSEGLSMCSVMDRVLCSQP